MCMEWLMIYEGNFTYVYVLQVPLCFTLRLSFQKAIPMKSSQISR